jgi:hypothetical protein
VVAELELTRYRRARYWDGAWPEQIYDAGGVLTRELEAAFRPMQDRLVAIEAVVPRGPRVMYGMLGGRYQAKTAGDLVVVVEYMPVGSELGERFVSPIAIASDVPIVGLPEEFAEAVVEGVHDVGPTERPGSGTLTFACAAHSLSGSSPLIFRALGRVVATLIASGSVPEYDVSAIVSDVLP